jgi:general secretion pathway protein D
VATIKVVDEWIYPTRYEYEIVQFDLTGDGDYNDAGETTYKNVPKDFLRRDVGILLKVIPAVGSDRKTINLSLIPEVSEGTADGFSYTGDVTLPKFTSRNLSTTVVVNSGETVVLGGLIKENRTKTLTKVPVLADIPFVGAFFRKNADSIERKNLIIFVTAKVLTPEGDEVVITQK